MKKSFKKYLLIVAVLIILLLNTLGLVIEFLFSANILETNLVNIRKINPVPLALSIGFIISGFFFIFNYYKNLTSSIKSWNIFMLIGALTVAYKLISPTYLSVLIPYYFIVMFLVIFAVWFLIFRHLRKR